MKKSYRIDSKLLYQYFQEIIWRNVERDMASTNRTNGANRAGQ